MQQTILDHPEVDKNQDGKIQYVLLEGEAGHQDAISRTDYSVKTLIEEGVQLEKLSYQFADWNRGQAENRMTRLISQYEDGIELVISNNDEMALGAVEAYRKSEYVPSEWEPSTMTKKNRHLRWPGFRWKSSVEKMSTGAS